MTSPGGVPRDDMIEAAGGVLWRAEGRQQQLAVIHRPRYDDWTLPKGKLDPGEDYEAAALREVAEETGHAAELGADLGEIFYEHDDRPKRVRYWSMRAVGGRFAPNREVDELRWLQADEAKQLLSYDRDRQVVDRFLHSGVTAG
jgi:8-oxo-dGTP diphosphatase